MPEYTNVLLLSNEGELLMQIGKEASQDLNSGTLAAFGGELARGESSRLAAIRELLQQTTIQVAPYRPSFRRTYSQSGTGSELHIFAVQDVDPISMKLLDDQSVVSVKAVNDFKAYNFSVPTREIVRDFFHKVIQH